MIKFQFHLIGLNHDSAHVGRFPRFLTANMKWSKNTREECNCPCQILCGSMNHNLCVSLTLALFLEKWCHEPGASSQWLFTEGITDRRLTVASMDKEDTKGKNNYSDLMESYAFQNQVFISERPEVK